MSGATVLRAGVIASSICLLIGLLWEFAAPGPIPARLLDLGIVVLLLTPTARLVVSFVEFLAERDWLFVGFAGIVLVELAAAVAVAFR